MAALEVVTPFASRLRRVPLHRDQYMLLMAVNMLFLGVDIYLAHTVSDTIRGYEEKINRLERGSCPTCLFADYLISNRLLKEA